MFYCDFSEKFMKKNIFLLLIAVFVLFISACTDDEDEIIAGNACYYEGTEICSDNGTDLLLCQDSTWTLKKQCNISIGKRCRQNANGVFGCFGDNEIDVPDSDANTNDPDTSDQNTEEPDTNDTSDTENETLDNSSTSEDPAENDDSDSVPQTDPEPSEPEPTDPDDAETPDNDSGDTGNVPDNDTDSDSDNDTDADTDNQEPPAGQCTSNSDCSGSTPYCSISTSQCIANAVFITEYVEGSNHNKAIEIYNGSKSAVNLSNFTIQQANNGKNWGNGDLVYSFAASTAIPSGQTFVFCNVASDTELVAKCDQTPTSLVFDFNGDDGIALFNGASVVDQIGNANEQTIWSVAGNGSTQDHTLRRKTTVIQGTTDWAASAGTTAEDSQWEVLSKDTFDGLGQR